MLRNGQREKLTYRSIWNCTTNKKTGYLERHCKRYPKWLGAEWWAKTPFMYACNVTWIQFQLSEIHLRKIHASKIHMSRFTWVKSLWVKCSMSKIPNALNLTKWVKYTECSWNVELFPSNHRTPHIVYILYSVAASCCWSFQPVENVHIQSVEANAILSTYNPITCWFRYSCLSLILVFVVKLTFYKCTSVNYS